MVKRSTFSNCSVALYAYENHHTSMADLELSDPFEFGSFVLLVCQMTAFDRCWDLFLFLWLTRSLVASILN